MDVLRITPRGYCHGVVDAFRIARRVRESTQGSVHMLGQLVHNTHATDELQEQGVALVTTSSTSGGAAIPSPRASRARRRAGSTWCRSWPTWSSSTSRTPGSP
jgi:hypothetical protein